MRITAIRCLVAGIATLQVLALSQAGAQSIGVNMNADGRGSNAADCTLAPTDVAGVVPQANWANLPNNETAVPPFDGTSANFRDSGGTMTAVQFEWIANDAWSNDSSAATPDHKMMRGMEKANPDDGVYTPHANSAMIFRWNNLIPGSTYNAIVYLAHNGGQTGPAKAICTLGGTTYYAQEVTAFDGVFDRSTTTTLPVDAAAWAATLAEYVQFDGVSPDANGTIEIKVEKFLENPQLADGLGVSGLQLVKVSGDWPVPAQPPVITEQPQDGLGIVGEDITTTIGIDGYWNVEWFKNGISVASGIDTAYTFTSTAADKDATIYAVVSNQAGSTTSDVVTVTLDDPLGEQLIQGFLRVEHYGGLLNGVADDQTTQAVYPDLYEHIPFQNREFDYEFYAGAFDLPDAGEDNYGRRLEGWVVPDATGSYEFFLRSDDGSELWVNPIGGTAGALPDLPTPSTSDLPDAQESGCCRDFQEYIADGPTTMPFSLTGGEYYAIVALHHEWGGGDFLQGAWREAADSTPANQLRPLGPANLYCMADPSGKRASITGQPQDVLALQGRTATFTVAVDSRPNANQYAIQWTKNGAAIPGANGLSYTTPPIAASDDGAIIQAQVFTLTPEGVLLSDPATITVNPDSVAPDVASAGAYSGIAVVGLAFSEGMDVTTITNPANYAVDGVTVTGVEVLGDGSDTVALTLSGAPAPGATVTVSGGTDFAGNPIGNGTATIENPELAAVTLVRAAGSDPANPGRSIPLGGGGMYMEAGGSDIWENQDSGHGAYQSFTGPFRMQVRVQSLAGPDNWTKAILDVRESTVGGSRHVNMTATRTAGQNQMSMDWRATTDGSSTSSNDQGTPRVGPVPYPNAWLRIDRPDAASNTFLGYLSSDGVNWDLHYTLDMAGAILPETLQLGMASTAHNNSSTLSEALFRDFSVVPLAVMEDPKIIAIGISGGNVTVDWQDGGELETSPIVTETGPWTPTGDSDGSFSEPVGADAQKFFRANRP